MQQAAAKVMNAPRLVLPRLVASISRLIALIGPLFLSGHMDTSSTPGDATKEKMPKQKNQQGGNKSHYWTDCLLPTAKKRWAGEETLFVTREYLDASYPEDALASPRRQLSQVDRTDPSESPSAFTS